MALNQILWLNFKFSVQTQALFVFLILTICLLSYFSISFHFSCLTLHFTNCILKNLSLLNLFLYPYYQYALYPLLTTMQTICPNVLMVFFYSESIILMAGYKFQKNSTNLFCSHEPKLWWLIGLIGLDITFPFFTWCCGFESIY